MNTRHTQRGHIGWDGPGSDERSMFASFNWRLYAARAAITAIVLYFSIAAYSVHESVWDAVSFAGFMLGIFILGEWHQKFRTSPEAARGNE